jgi:hypothetical protein
MCVALTTAGAEANVGATADAGRTVQAPTAPPDRRCHQPLAVARGGAGVVDPDELTTRQLVHSDAVLRRAEQGQPDHGKQGRASIAVDVYVHVLRTRDSGGVSRNRISRQLSVLNHAFAGRQSRWAARAPFRFRMANVDVTVNQRWYRMVEGSLEESKAKHSLRRGGRDTLNLYIGSNASGVLGWGTQPSRLAGEPAMDGVVIARHTLPGGGGGHYSAGDAAVHETGHWLGLFHTFAGKCGRRGDFVDDTPAERRPSYSCPVGRDSCDARGRDPVHNFMDYSYDGCMDRFTKGQVSRMVRSWNALRSMHVVGPAG